MAFQLPANRKKVEGVTAMGQTLDTLSFSISAPIKSLSIYCRFEFKDLIFYKLYLFQTNRCS